MRRPPAANSSSLPLFLPPSGATSCAARFDRAFFFGDLNYRIAGNRDAVDKLLAPADDRTRAAADWVDDEFHDDPDDAKPAD